MIKCQMERWRGEDLEVRVLAINTIQILNVISCVLLYVLNTVC